jgi:hypothetical protein
MKSKLFFVLTLLTMSFFLNGRTIIIPEDFSTIQEGINNSADSDTVLVNTGTYNENIDFSGKSIVLGSLFLTTGDTSYISQTIIDGGGTGRVVNISGGESSDAVLTGLTITNGYSSQGSGINIIDSSPMISNNIIKDNEMTWYGSGCGIYMKRSSSTIINNLIKNNDGAYNGCGIRVDSCYVVSLKNNKISDHITNSGYGVAGSCALTIGNTDSVFIENCLFYDNYVDLGQGDMIGSSNSTVKVKNCTFYNRYSAGYNLFNVYGDFSITNSIIWSGNNYLGGLFYNEDSVNVSYSNIKDGYEGMGNISSDSKFTDLYSFGLQLQSPCINRGDPSSESDPDGTVADMGWKAYDLSGYGTVSGTVTLDEGIATMESVWINSGEETAFPLSSGDYMLHLLPGDHDISAYLSTHESQTTEGITIISNQETAGIDFHLTNSSLPGIIEVSKDGTKDFTIIQDAVNIALPGDTILVHNGIYEESLTISNKSFYLTSNFLFTNDSLDIQNTIMDGKNEFRPLYIEDTPDTNLTIEGLTIQNGYSVTKGGGCFIKNSYSNIRNCNITYNHSESNGGGLHNENSKSILTNCQISDNYGSRGGGISNEYLANIKINSSNIINNSGWWGGGIYSYRSEYNIEMCTISYNIGRGYGGGLYEYSSTEKSKLMSSIINYNTSDRSGGGIYFDDLTGESIVMNCIISNNTTTDSISGGGGITCRESCPILVNNTIANNTTIKSGGGVKVWSQSRPYSRPSFYNNIIWRNTASEGNQVAIGGEDSDPNFYFCNIMGGIEGFAYIWESSPETNTGDYINNIDSDPLFLDEWNGDYFLTENSPCIDAGTQSIPDSISFPEYDLAGNVRIFGATIDIGAYEWQGVGIGNSNIPLSTKLYQNYPNPFNPVTTISYALSAPGNVELNVYNLNGQLLNTLVDCRQDKGSHKVKFYAGDMTSGLYIYKLKVDGKFIQSRKMLMVK